MGLLQMLRRRHEAMGGRHEFTPAQAPPPSGLDAATINALIARVPYWFHYIELGHGIVTPGHQGGEGRPWATRAVLDNLHLPADMTGKGVLDIGAYDGYFTFACEARGAHPILAIDNHYRLEREGKHLETGSLGFEVAHEILASRAEYKAMDVLDVSPKELGMFDIVLFLGVLYHLRHPLLALEKIAAVTKEMMILETHTDTSFGERSVAAFYGGEELNNDPTNWWGPTPACAEAMVRAAGFPKVTRVAQFGSRCVLHAFK